MENVSCFYILLPFSFVFLGSEEAGNEAICSLGLVDDKVDFYEKILKEKLKSRNTQDACKNRGLVEDYFLLQFRAIPVYLFFIIHVGSSDCQLHGFFYSKHCWKQNFF